ncbi:MAG: FeoA family protein [Thermoproteota archaeon]
MPLAMLPLGVEGRISGFQGGRGLVRRLVEMGFQPGERVRVVHSNRPGPVVVEVKDTRLALGRGMAMKVMVEVG